MTILELKEEIISWKPSRERVVHLSVCILAIVVYEFFALRYYRPFIYANRINGFHIADTLGNSLGTVAVIFVFIGFLGRSREQHLFIIASATIRVVLYELLHPLLGKPIDLFDVVATVLSGGFCFLLYFLLNSRKIDSQQIAKRA